MVSMTERLRYENYDDGIILRIPDEVMEKVIDSETLLRTFSLPAKQRVVNFESKGQEGANITLNYTKAGSMRDHVVRGNAFTQLTKVSTEVASLVPYDLEDPALNVNMSREYINAGDRLGMSAELAWPELADQDIQQVATDAMRSSAVNLRYASRRIIPSLVYALVSRSEGITLETNPAGSCSLDTDGMHYDPEASKVELYAHNLYAREMQLICLSGLVAIARA
ncbi:MAG: hypothetical protein JWN33_644 [Candidatus Saccharibacteria bacterium]|nr:hypothetical protein [Candidatus Saccharibacteria bacterium]